MNDETCITASQCDCADTVNAQRLNSYCLCPQEPARVEGDLQIAAVPVFVAANDHEKMSRLIAAIETVFQSAAWRQRALEAAPAIARHHAGNPGVLFGFDFHLHASGPQLIEINSNAGGALIVTQVLRAQSGCCAGPAEAAPRCQAEQAETAIIDSLLADFAAVRGDREPQLVAIVDTEPTAQYLYPEFLRFAQLLRERGLRAAICDPSELQRTRAGLTLHGETVDLVYNRLTDFYFADEAHAALREAYRHDEVVVTPNPHHHALYADKRHLALLSDPAVLQALGVDAGTAQILLDSIPEARLVDTAHAEELWQRRREFFFKPASAYGSKGVYRGAKLTRKTFEELLHSDYIAQREVEPPLRRAWVDGEEVELKVDVRCYVYRGAIQLTAARLWRGQTTNFRTPGGGFATVNKTVA